MTKTERQILDAINLQWGTKLRELHLRFGVDVTKSALEGLTAKKLVFVAYAYPTTVFAYA